VNTNLSTNPSGLIACLMIGAFIAALMLASGIINYVAWHVGVL
jgi:hypothetical protein